MREKKEIREAIAACDRVIADIDGAIGELTKANKWAFWDLMGGEFVSSFLKRSKISKANKKIKSLEKSLIHLEKELGDLGLSLPRGLSDSFSDKFWDIYFDNIFTDIRVRSELKKKIGELKTLRKKIVYLKKKLEKSKR